MASVQRGKDMEPRRLGRALERYHRQPFEGKENEMEMRPLGNSGLHVSALSFGTMSFGGEGFFQTVGNTEQAEGERLIGLCLDHGINLFDTADAYSLGRSEEILGRALGARRQDVLIATQGFSRMGQGPNGMGSSRYHLMRAVEGSLRRLGTDYIDLYQMHAYDELTPIEETLRALDDLVRAGKVRYIGCSNYAGWQLMKALACADRHGWSRYISQQIYYSLAGRDAEHELVPLGLDQGVGILVYGGLAYGLLSGKFRRGAADPQDARATMWNVCGTERERVLTIVEVMVDIATQRNVPVSQVAINWLLRKPGVTSVIFGARNEAQLEDNLGAASWCLSPEEVSRLDAISETPLRYPYSFYRDVVPERSPYFRKEQ